MCVVRPAVLLKLLSSGSRARTGVVGRGNLPERSFRLCPFEFPALLELTGVLCFALELWCILLVSNLRHLSDRLFREEHNYYISVSN